MVIEQTLIEYLEVMPWNQTTLPVYAETPKQPVPRNYIVIDKTGSSYANGITRATIAIQSISADSLLTAAQINETVVAYMEEFYKVQNIFGAHLQADYNFTNTTTKQYRYQAVYEINYKR